MLPRKLRKLSKGGHATLETNDSEAQVFVTSSRGVCRQVHPWPFVLSGLCEKFNLKDVRLLRVEPAEEVH